MNIVLRFILASIVTVSFTVFIACTNMPVPPGYSASSGSSGPAAAAAIGWIGGGTNGWQTGSAPGFASNYQSFYYPEGVCADSSGNIYVADFYNNRICKWNSSGIAQGWIGGGTNGWQTGSAPGFASDYQSFKGPCDVYVDSSGNIYVADYDNSRVCKWTSSGVAIGWIGGGNSGWQTGSNPSWGTNYQSFYGPSGIYVDSSGNIYVADSDNNRICKWNSAGVAIGWISGDNGWHTGPALASGTSYRSFNCPEGVCVDSSGNIYVADSYNNRICKWNSAGVPLGWIGGGNSGWQTGSAPTNASDYQSFYGPSGIYVDSSGNIYVADHGNNRICKWASSGAAIGWIGGGTNVWQTGSGASYGTGGAYFYLPTGVYVDSSNNIYVADWYNNRISKWH
jgi:sugar lactone lactonase YvrE